MARVASGQILEREGKRGRTYALRFRAYGHRQYVTLGTAEDGWTRQRADEELQNVLADVRRGIWRPFERQPAVDRPRPEPTFHEFASEWLEGRRHELGERTVEDYTWALSNHLLPFFARHRLGAITVEEVDRYRSAKVREGRLSAASTNKTITRLAQVLEAAEEYGHVDAIPPAGGGGDSSPIRHGGGSSKPSRSRRCSTGGRASRAADHGDPRRWTPCVRADRTPLAGRQPRDRAPARDRLEDSGRSPRDRPLAGAQRAA